MNMLSPKKTKYRKQFKGRIHGNAKGNFQLNYVSGTPTTISGADDARLIYLGVLSGLPFEDQSYVIVDIGGGSTELILADKKDALALTSARVGAVRLKNDFLNSGAINSERSRFLKIFIQGSLEPSVLKIKRRLKNDKPVSMIATSGTATSLGNLILDELGQPKQKIHGYKLKREN